MTHLPLITQSFLQDIGVAIPDDQLAAFTEHLETTLDERITNEIVEELDDDQLEQLAALRDGSGEQLSTWLKENVPDLDEIVKEETAILLGELAEHADKL